MKNTVSGTQVPRFPVAVEALRQCLGIDAKHTLFLFEQARKNKSDLLIEMRNRERASAPHLTDRAVAKISNLRFLSVLDPSKIKLRPQMSLLKSANLRVVTYEKEPGKSILLLAPREMDLPRLYTMRKFFRVRSMEIVIVSPHTLRSALIMATRQQRLQEATFGLLQQNPENSSERVSTAPQGFILGCSLLILLYSLVFHTSQTFFFLHLLASFFFFLCVALRGFAIPLAMQKKKHMVEVSHETNGKTYCVLIPLHKEAEIIGQLISSMEKLDWPIGQLKIILICEEDDHKTIEALECLRLQQHFSVVKVPFALPQTKPKALNFALSTVQADYVVVYDAEDRPHPLQLKEAYRKFSNGSKNNACLQAPLIISNGSQSVLSRLFAFEYSALFRGLLPFLAKRKLFLPLGGTSNHFDMKKLREIGAWDPFNVTEDADLGLRLRRVGFQTDTLLLPTYEDAPCELKVWIKQRTRWLKGWAQTWLVFMRHPIRALVEIGLGSFFLAQILFVGLLTSAALHLFVFLGYVIVLSSHFILGTTSNLLPTFVEFDLLNFLLGYLSFFTLGVITTRIDHPEIELTKVALTLPIYWALLSVSAWRAIWHLIFKPHLWEKTPHKPVESLSQ